MIEWEPKHRWEEVADDLRARILVGRNTALRAIAALAEEGIVVVKRSRGTFVVPPEYRPER